MQTLSASASAVVEQMVVPPEGAGDDGRYRDVVELLLKYLLIICFLYVLLSSEEIHQNGDFKLLIF